MAKKDNPQFSPAEDYLAHINWHSMPRYRRWPWWTEPAWDYKIIYSKKRYSSNISLFIMGGITLFIGSILLYNAFVKSIGYGIFICILLIVIFVILFFAVRDAKTPTDED